MPTFHRIQQRVNESLRRKALREKLELSGHLQKAKELIKTIADSFKEDKSKAN